MRNWRERKRKRERVKGTSMRNWREREREGERVRRERESERKWTQVSQSILRTQSDVTGFETYLIRIKNLQTGELLPDTIAETSGTSPSPFGVVGSETPPAFRVHFCGHRRPLTVSE